MSRQRASSSTRRRRPDSRRRILILDDHPIMRLGLTRLIEGEPDLMVCGEAADAAAALALLGVAAPHLVIADVAIPGLSIFEFIRKVRTRYPALPVLILSNYDEVLYAQRMLQAGASGYVMKREGGGTLLSAVRQVLDGRSYFSETMTALLLNALRRDRKGSSVVPQLSDREFEVLRCVGDGKTTREAASELHISAKTVETHRLSLCRKLGLKSAAALLRFAVHFEESGVRGLVKEPAARQVRGEQPQLSLLVAGPH